MIGLTLAIVGVVLVYSGPSGAPMYMRATLMMYVVKVIYSFSVDHYAASDTSAP